jgi:putative sigma-54 modulation protein
MQVLVTFRHMEATEPLRRHAESKVARVRKFLREPIEAHVVLEVNKRRHFAEITLSGPHHLTVNAKEETGDLYSAIDAAMTKIEHQIQKRVTKLRTRKKGVTPEAVPAAPARRKDKGAITAERVTVEPMSVAEAVKRLARRSTGFLLFQNEATDALSVLYRRKDGGYSLVEPEIG